MFQKDMHASIFMAILSMCVFGHFLGIVDFGFDHRVVIEIKTLEASRVLISTTTLWSNQKSTVPNHVSNKPAPTPQNIHFL